ncbi:MAG TPA: hypothetical protein PKD91_06160 [Bacteroidia bacterium]|nr:hypothetical protein [Bacteroidia bacterium]
MDRKINKLKIVCLGVMFMGLAACQTSFDEINYMDGRADFSRFVSVGGGYMAGYADNALYREAQMNSAPALMASRFSLVGGGIFTQPMINPGPGLGLHGNSKYVLMNTIDPCGTKLILEAHELYDTADVTNYNWLGNAVPFNNLAVPGARIDDLFKQSFGDPSPFLGNALYSRFASNPSTSTVAGDALLINPTFTAIWTGIEDIYNYALGGGDQGYDSLTKPVSFSEKFDDLIAQIIPVNSGAVIANIPSLNTIPAFTAIPWNGLVLDAATAANLNAQYAIVDPTISFVAGENRFVIADASMPTGRRQISNGEYILLSVPRDSLVCAKWGTTTPIPARYIIDAGEAGKINNAVAGYNNVILQAAAAGNFAIADMNTVFRTLKSGIVFNGVNYSTQYLKESAFSTDGFYLNQRGYAFVANEFLNAINKSYGSNLPSVDVNSLPGIVFP